MKCLYPYFLQSIVYTKVTKEDVFENYHFLDSIVVHIPFLAFSEMKDSECKVNMKYYP